MPATTLDTIGVGINLTRLIAGDNTTRPDTAAGPGFTTRGIGAATAFTTRPDTP